MSNITPPEESSNKPSSNDFSKESDVSINNSLDDLLEELVSSILDLSHLLQFLINEIKGIENTDSVIKVLLELREYLSNIVCSMKEPLSTFEQQYMLLNHIYIFIKNLDDFLCNATITNTEVATLIIEFWFEQYPQTINIEQWMSTMCIGLIDIHILKPIIDRVRSSFVVAETRCSSIFYNLIVFCIKLHNKYLNQIITLNVVVNINNNYIVLIQKFKKFRQVIRKTISPPRTDCQITDSKGQNITVKGDDWDYDLSLIRNKIDNTLIETMFDFILQLFKLYMTGMLPVTFELIINPDFIFSETTIALANDFSEYLRMESFLALYSD